MPTCEEKVQTYNSTLALAQQTINELAEIYKLATNTLSAGAPAAAPAAAAATAPTASAAAAAPAASAAPAAAQAVIACGNKDINSADSRYECEDMKLESATTQHAVRCCSDTQKDGYSKKPECSVWAESKFKTIGDGNAGCADNKTLAEATAICAAEDARLCTAEEVDNRCTRRTGCGHDFKMVWTSSTAVPTSL